jgi:hypothetical protein
MNPLENRGVVEPGDQHADAGILVGLTPMMSDEVRLPDSSLRNHWLVLGRSGVGKSTLVKHVVARKLARKAAGDDNGPLIVVDTHRGLVPGILKLVPTHIVDQVRLLDFGREDRVPRINLVDPHLFPDRDRCVDTVINTCRRLWHLPDGRWEDLLRHCLLLLYEFNRNSAKEPDEMLGMLQIPALLDEDNLAGQDGAPATETINFLDHVLTKVSDPWLRAWFQNLLEWDPEFRRRTTAPVHNRINAYNSHQLSPLILGPGRSTVALSDTLSDGLVILVSVDTGSLGAEMAGLLGGSVVSMIESALRGRGLLEDPNAVDCLLVCDEFHAVPGPSWDILLSDIRKYGCSLMLSTQSLAGVGTRERELRASALGSAGCLVGFQMGTQDAKIIAEEMANDRVEDRYLSNLDKFQCYLRLDADGRRYPLYPMKILPPPEGFVGTGDAYEKMVAASNSYTLDVSESRGMLYRRRGNL